MVNSANADRQNILVNYNMLLGQWECSKSERFKRNKSYLGKL